MPTTAAEHLRIEPDMCVWTVGSDVETRGIVDPLPDGCWTVDERVPGVDVLVIGTDHHDDLMGLADDILPQIGSIDLVWVIFPQRHTDLDTNAVRELADDYGWQIAETTLLDETWQAERLTQA